MKAYDTSEKPPRHGCPHYSKKKPRGMRSFWRNCRDPHPRWDTCFVRTPVSLKFYRLTRRHCLICICIYCMFMLSISFPLANHGGGIIMLQRSFSSPRTEKLIRFDRKIDGGKYRVVLEGKTVRGHKDGGSPFSRIAMIIKHHMNIWTYVAWLVSTVIMVNIENYLVGQIQFENWCSQTASN